MNRIPVYVPAPDQLFTAGIKPGSGIVGRPTRGDNVLIFFEGNVYGAENMGRYVERVQQAAGRMSEGAPTSSLRIVPRTALVCVGEFDGSFIDVWEQEGFGLHTWLGFIGAIPVREFVL